MSVLQGTKTGDLEKLWSGLFATFLHLPAQRNGGDENELTPQVFRSILQARKDIDPDWSEVVQDFWRLIDGHLPDGSIVNKLWKNKETQFLFFANHREANQWKALDTKICNGVLLCNVSTHPPGLDTGCGFWTFDQVATGVA